MPASAASPPVKTRTRSAGTANTYTDNSSGRSDDDELRPYVISGELGKGSFATVYKGYHEDTKEQLAIKTVSRSILTSKLFDNLQSEIDILKSLSHRHITKLIDIVRAEKNIYLIMEYCSGGDLTNYIKKRGRVETLEYVPSPGAAPIYYPHPKQGGLDEIVVRSFLRQLARALKFLRSRNLIHRDIKPQNLLLKPPSAEELRRGHPIGVPILKVADFGFARSLPNAMMAETLCGSPLYMAPEILRYEKYDAKADLWSVGAVVFETAAGRPPFRAQNHIELLKRIEHSKGVKFPEDDPEYMDKYPDARPVPSDIKDLIRSLLKRFPAERAGFDEFFKSTALANSKFPRASSSRSESKEGSSKSEAVVVGTLARRPMTVLESPFPESSRPAPAPPVLARKPSETARVSPPGPSFRRRSGYFNQYQEPPMPVPDAYGDIPRGGSPSFPADMDPDQPEPIRRISSEAKGKGRPLSTEASIIPGESEEDGMLRREYVLVGDTRAIEFNKTVDEITAGRRRPTQSRKPSSPTVEKRPSEFYSPDDILSKGPSPTAVTAFPPPPNPYAPPLSASPSRRSALTRAINIASKKLFGTTARTSSGYFFGRDSSRSPRRQPLLLGKTVEEDSGIERDPLEELLLTELEDLAQKTHVVTKWADEMYEYVKAIPQKPLPPTSKFKRREDETDRQADRRRNADIDAEYNAVTCVAVYLLLMSFSQKGIERLQVHQEGMKMRDPEGRLEVSEGFDDALTWFSKHFETCSDRVALVKTWLPETSMEGPSWLGQLVYDRALQLSRKAASMELVDQGSLPIECEQLYEESLWCLYALQDDIMQAGNPYRDEDKVTISNWIEKTKKRLESCRKKRLAREGTDGGVAGTETTTDKEVRYRSPPWENNNGSPRR